MSLTAGQKLGPYEIIAAAGAGGMGEVYKAKDSRLDRVVAIKVLPTRTAQSADMRSRFDREAKAISSLNHPNICTLHDIGHQDGIDYLVMEYIDGDTLASRLSKGPLSSSELFAVASQIADALDKAHRQGLVHRDLKPGNIMLTKTGAKLLDFGLAKLQQVGGVVEGISGATRTSPLTGEGTLIGTVQYMSPEQLEGKEADARSDIFAFGATLYEMATGKRAFEGSSQASLIGAIMKEDPKPISAIQPMTPPALELVVKQCLAKDPDNRWQSAGDLNRALQWVSQSGSQLGMAMPTAVPFSRKLRQWAGWVVAAAAVAIVIFQVFTTKQKSQQVIRAEISPPEGNTFLFEGDDAGPPAISPDGTQIAYVAVSPSGAKIWLRDLSLLTSRSLNGTEGAAFPFWSPDGKSLGFYSQSKLMRIDITTGQVFSICQTAGKGRGGAWSPSDTIIFTPDFQSELFSVSAAGGIPIAITHKDTSQHSTHRWPFFLPDGRHFLYFAGNHFKSDSIENSIWFASMDGRENHLVMPNLSDAKYSGGNLFFVRDSVLFAQSFDPSSGKLSGEPIATKDKIQVDRTTWKANFSISGKQILAYQDVGGKQGCQMLLLDRGGNILKTIGGQGNHYNLDMSPDGRDLIYSSQEQPYGDLYHYDLERKLKTRLTFDSNDKDVPVFSPSGNEIAYSTLVGSANNNNYEIRTMSATGIGAERLIAKDSVIAMWPMAWSPDEKYLMCGQGDQNRWAATKVTLVPMAAGGRVITLFDGPGTILSARFSPDGKWIAYESPSSGSAQIFVIPSPIYSGSAAESGTASGSGGSGRWQISASGGSHPIWRGDSKELYYIRTDGMAAAVDVSSDKDGFRVGHESELFKTVMRLTYSCWDVTADGQSFVVNSLSGGSSTHLVIVQNWEEELKK